MGHLIPAGTGLKKFRNIMVVPTEEGETVELTIPAEEPSEKKKISEKEKTVS